MNENETPQSGFVNDADAEFEIATSITDIEILHVSKTNIIARGRRYGRFWLLKGLRPEFRTSNAHRRQLQKEFEIHSRLLDAGVVKAIGFENVNDELGLCIIEEWVEGRTLAELLREGKLTVSDRRRIIRDLIRTVGYLHECGVMHRDLKPENVMVRDAGGKVVIIDFGLADTDDYAELKHGAGTPGYLSPEQANDSASRTSDDIYSLGVIMKQLCPEYGRIAARCTGPVDGRPKDAAALLKCIDRHDRRPKILWIAAACVALAAACATIGVHYYTLARDTKMARERAVMLTETNQKNEQRVVELTDSLTGVTDRMVKAESEIKRIDSYNEARARAYVEGCKKIDTFLKNFDIEVHPYLDGEPTAEFYDKVALLRKKLEFICNQAFDPADYPELHEDDKYKLREELHNFYVTAYSSYYSEWQAKFYKTHVQREWGSYDYGERPANERRQADTITAPPSN